ncbi:PKD domain-containing protein [Flavobacteriales bacterium]|nr:PKD domain-containing protein [Flavobacteriales bacterium]
MTLIILSFLFNKRFSLLKSKLIHLFLILVAMLISSSASSQQVSADFTTLSATNGCGSLVVEFQDLSSGSPDTWLWDFGNGNSSVLQNPTIIYVDPGMYDVKLTVSNSTTTDTKIINGLIKVYNLPIAEVSTNSVISGCIPLAVDFEDVSVTDNTIVNWQWDFGDGGASILQHPLYQYENNGNFSVSLSVTDANGCQSLSIETDLIQADKVAGANFIADITFSCNSAQVVSFTNNTLLPASYIWDFGDGNTSFLENPSHNYLSGMYTTSLFSKIGSCIDTIVKTNYIEVGSDINPEFIYDINAGCEGIEVNFTDMTLNNPDSWFWDFGDGNTSVVQNPTHSYINSGLYDVTLTTARSGQCEDSRIYYDAIEIYADPVIQIIADTTYSCTIPFNVEFVDITADAVIWDWDFGDGTTSMLSESSALYNSYGSYNISLTVEDSKGCSSTKEFINFITIEDISIAISASTINGCVPFDVEFIDSTHSIRPLIDWNWNFGDGNFSNTQTPSHQYNTAGSFEISLAVENDYGCILHRNFPDYIRSNIIPEAEFEAAPILSCAGENINFFDLSTSTDSITSWFWDFGNNYTSTLKNPIYQYQLPGIYDVTLIAGINNCKDTFLISDYIKIIEPAAFFSEEYSCDTPLTVKFNNLSIGADNVLWDFGDGTTSNALNPVHSYSAKGLYDVILFVNNSMTGCTHKFIKPIKLTIPQASFDYLPISGSLEHEDSVGCIPRRVYLDNTSQDYEWIQTLWSDSSIEYSTSHLFTTEGVFDVTMVISDIHGCKDTATTEDMYYMYSIDVDFGISNILGCDSMLVEFEDLSTPSCSLNWDFGDGGVSSINNPQYIYYNQGIYDVTTYAVSEHGCKDTLKRLEYINFQYPIADFTSNLQEVCHDDIIQFSNLSTGIGMNSIWDFGDGTQSVQLNPLHSFVVNGMYDISLLVTDSFGCSSNKVFPQYIEALEPIANFITAGVSSNCPPLISDFTNLSSADANLFTWNFNDGSSNSIIENPSHLFSNSGVFSVSLIVENSFGCKDTLVQNGLIDISGPIGSFSVSDTLVCKNDSIHFLPLVSNTDLYLWDFGNGILSTDSFPNYIYTNNGVYHPVLIIENSSGCQYIINDSDTITVRSVDVEAGIDVEICEGDQVQLDASGNATQFSWSPTVAISNPNISNPIVTPTTDVMYYIHHYDWMCNAYDSVFIKVNNEIPTPSFITSNHCEGDITQFNAYSGLMTTNISWEWDFGANIQDPLQELPLGMNNIELVALNLDNNCSDTISQQVEIYPLPNADFYATNVCFGEQVLFTNNSSSNTVSWVYNFDDGIGSSNSQSPIYIYTSPGIYNVTLEVTSDNGCNNNVIKGMTVYELPITDFSVENHCDGKGNIFTDLSSVINSDILSIQYNFNNSSVSSDSIVTHIFDGHGFFNVELTAITTEGCESTMSRVTEVFANPVVDFSVLGFCEGEQTSFNDFSFVENTSISDWNWTLGLESLSFNKNTSHIFSTNGIYNINLSVISEQGCTGDLSQKIEIYKLPIANFDIPTHACFGDEVEISNLSDDNIIEWYYTFGDGNSSYEKNPTHTYDFVNQFDISLEVTSPEGCVNDTTMPAIIEIHPLPIADFQANTLIASEIESEIKFFNQSIGASSYIWSFDNENYSFEENPIYYFNNTQNYEVILTAINDFSCSSEIMKVVYIHPEYSFYIPNSFTPNNDGKNDIFLAQGNGIISSDMQVFNRWGGLVFESSNIEFGWNGLDANSNKLEEGLYLYHISLYDYNGKLWVYNGEFKLMR